MAPLCTWSGASGSKSKRCSLGEVTRTKRGEVCTQQLSTFSRLSGAERFAEAALVETHRRGLERAAAVCAVQDGAEWLQGLVDYHCADAVRILDFAHAAEYVNQIGEAVRAAGGRLPTAWLDGVLHRLKHQGPERVLTHLTRLTTRYPSEASQEHLTYLQKRAAQMQYPTYQAAGWPIGSGSVESANKRVVEARLKGAGMRLPSAERQPHARAPQCRLQSAVERDVGSSGDPAASAAHESAASRQPATPNPRLFDPGLLGSTSVSDVSSPCSSYHRTSGCCHRAAISSSSWLWLFLAQTFSQTPSFRPRRFREKRVQKNEPHPGSTRLEGTESPIRYTTHLQGQ